MTKNSFSIQLPVILLLLLTVPYVAPPCSCSPQSPPLRWPRASCRPLPPPAGGGARVPNHPGRTLSAAHRLFPDRDKDRQLLDGHMTTLTDGLTEAVGAARVTLESA